MLLAGLVDLLELVGAEGQFGVVGGVELVEVLLGTALLAGGGGDDALGALERPAEEDAGRVALGILGRDRGKRLVERAVFGQGRLVEGRKGGVGHRDDAVLLLEREQLGVLFVRVAVGVLYRPT